MQSKKTSGFRQTPLDNKEHHPTILAKCGNVKCNHCKPKAVKSYEKESGYINVSTPIETC